MFEIGTNVVFGNHGICRIEDIATGLEFGMPKSLERAKLMYYKLSPLFVTAYSVIYTPVDNSDSLREAIGEKEAREYLSSLSESEVEVFGDNSQGKLREHYQQLTADDMPDSYLRLIKEVHRKKVAAGLRHKRLGQVDEIYLKRAEELVCREFAAALNTTPELIKARIYEVIGEGL